MDDPIIREVRSTREGLVAEKGGLEGLLKYLRAKEAEHPERTATPAQRHAEKARGGSGGASEH